MKLLNGPSNPGLLQTIKNIARPWEYLETCAQRYGDPFIDRDPKSPDVVYFSHPQALKEIFTADPGKVLPVRHGPIMAPPTGMRMVVTSERPTNTQSLSLIGSL